MFSTPATRWPGTPKPARWPRSRFGTRGWVTSMKMVSYCRSAYGCAGPSAERKEFFFCLPSTDPCCRVAPTPSRRNRALWRSRLRQSGTCWANSCRAYGAGLSTVQDLCSSRWHFRERHGEKSLPRTARRKPQQKLPAALEKRKNPTADEAKFRISFASSASFAVKWCGEWVFDREFPRVPSLFHCYCRRE